MELQKAIIKNKVSGVTYPVTRSQWETIQASGLAGAYEMVQGFPPVVELADLPEVQEITAQPADDQPVGEPPADPPASPTEEPEADKPTGKKGKGKG